MTGYPFTGIQATDFRVSNREDLFLTLSVFDDELNQAINLSGVTLANPAAFTSNAWTVTDGAISTTSSTSITIPTYPITGQLSALALTVGLNLNILPGDQIVIADTATGQNTMVGTVTSYAAATGALVVQIGWAFDFEIRRDGNQWNWNGYVPWYDWGTPSTDFQSALIANLGSGVSIIDVGFVQIRIPAISQQGSAQISTLLGGTYTMALVGTDGFDTRELLNAPLHVDHGGVRQSPFTPQPSNSQFAIEF